MRFSRRLTLSRLSERHVGAAAATNPPTKIASKIIIAGCDAWAEPSQRLLNRPKKFSIHNQLICVVFGRHADGLRARYLPGSSFAHDFSFDPQGAVVERQTRGSFVSGSWAYDTAVYEGYGAKRSDYGAFSSAATHAPSHTDPVGFGGQFGYYTDTETGLLCLTHRYHDLNIE